MVSYFLFILVFGGFPISHFLLSFLFFDWCVFVLFSFPPNSHNAHGKKKKRKKKEGAPRPRLRGRGAPKFGGIEVSRDFRSVEVFFRCSH